MALPNAASRGTDDMMHEGRGRLHEPCCGCMSAVLRDVMEVAIGIDTSPGGGSRSSREMLRIGNANCVMGRTAVAMLARLASDSNLVNVINTW